MFGNREAGYEYSPETVVVLRQEAIAEWWRTVWLALSLTRHVLPIGLGAFAPWQALSNKRPHSTLSLQALGK